MGWDDLARLTQFDFTVAELAKSFGLQPEITEGCCGILPKAYAASATISRRVYVVQFVPLQLAEKRITIRRQASVNHFDR